VARVNGIGLRIFIGVPENGKPSWEFEGRFRMGALVRHIGLVSVYRWGLGREGADVSSYGKMRFMGVPR